MGKTPCLSIFLVEMTQEFGKGREKSLQFVCRISGRIVL